MQNLETNIDFCFKYLPEVIDKYLKQVLQSYNENNKLDIQIYYENRYPLIDNLFLHGGEVYTSYTEPNSLYLPIKTMDLCKLKFIYQTVKSYFDK